MKWPEKLKTFDSNTSEHDRGWNACLEACNEVRKRMSRVSPHLLYKMANGDAEKYKDLMVAHGYLMPKKTQIHPNTTEWNEGARLAAEYLDGFVDSEPINNETFQRGYEAGVKASKQGPGLAPLNYKEIFEMLSDRTNYTQETCGELAMDICRKFGTQGPGLESLNIHKLEHKIHEALKEYKSFDDPIQSLSAYLADAICSKFGTRPVPTVLEICKEINDRATLHHSVVMEIAKAICAKFGTDFIIDTNYGGK